MTGDVLDDFPLVDQSVIDELTEDLGTKLLAKLLATYRADARRHLEAMTAAAEAGQAEALEREAHALKGCSLNLGILRVGHGCEALRVAVRHSANIIQRLEVLALAIAETEAALDLMKMS